MLLFFTWMCKGAEKRVGEERNEMYGGKQQQQQKRGFIWCTMAIQRNHRQILWHSFGFFLTFFCSLPFRVMHAHKHFYTHIQTANKRSLHKFMRDMSFNETVISSGQAYLTSQSDNRETATTPNNWDANKKNMLSLWNFQMIWSRMVNILWHSGPST